MTDLDVWNCVQLAGGLGLLCEILGMRYNAISIPIPELLHLLSISLYINFFKVNASRSYHIIKGKLWIDRGIFLLCLFPCGWYCAMHQSCHRLFVVGCFCFGRPLLVLIQIPQYLNNCVLLMKAQNNHCLLRLRLWMNERVVYFVLFRSHVSFVVLVWFTTHTTWPSSGVWLCFMSWFLLSAGSFPGNGIVRKFGHIFGGRTYHLTTDLKKSVLDVFVVYIMHLLKLSYAIFKLPDHQLPLEDGSWQWSMQQRTSLCCMKLNDHQLIAAS